jgi:DNA-binding transcriptional regulator GbsR (MarR family)
MPRASTPPPTASPSPIQPAPTAAKSTPTASGLVRSAGRAIDLIAFEEAIVDFFVDAAELLGVPKSVAAIYGIVFASPVPLSFADIGERLDFSKGSISQGIRVLKEVGALREVSASTDRMELFEPEMELRKLVVRFLENRIEKQLETGRARLAGLQRSIPNLNPAAAKLRERVKHLQGSHDKARALVPIARAFLKLGG